MLLRLPVLILYHLIFTTFNMGKPVRFYDVNR